MNTPIPEKAGSCMEVRLNSPRGKFQITNMGDDQVDLASRGHFWCSLLVKKRKEN